MMTPAERAAELAVLREGTEFYISCNPTTIEIQRPVKVDDGEGGFSGPSLPLDPQTMRLITQNEGVNVVSAGIDGEEINPEFVLLAMWDADVRAGDWFTLAAPDIKYDVKFVRDNHNYEVWAGVEKRG